MWRKWMFCGKRSRFLTKVKCSGFTVAAHHSTKWLLLSGKCWSRIVQPGCVWLCTDTQTHTHTHRRTNHTENVTKKKNLDQPSEMCFLWFVVKWAQSRKVVCLIPAWSFPAFTCPSRGFHPSSPFHSTVQNMPSSTLVTKARNKWWLRV